MADETTPSDDNLIEEAAKKYGFTVDEVRKAVREELLARAAKEVVDETKPEDYPDYAVW